MWDRKFFKNNIIFMKLYPRQEYKKIKQTILADKWLTYCPFCHPQDDKDLLLWEWKYWFIVHNKYPIWGRDDHIMAIPKRCVEFTKDLNWQEMSEFPEVETFMSTFYKDHSSYWSMIRQSSNIKSILHLHYHYLPWDIHARDIESMFESQDLRSNI